MNSTSWVLDTNVVVSGLLVAQGFSGRLLDAILADQLRLTYDDRIEAEYREVLARPRLGISPERREAFLSELLNQDAVMPVRWTELLPPDQDDLPFLEAALHATQNVLVTGNTKHYPKKCCGIVQVLTPRQAWETLGRAKG